MLDKVLLRLEKVELAITRPVRKTYRAVIRKYRRAKQVIKKTTKTTIRLAHKYSLIKFTKRFWKSTSSYRKNGWMFLLMIAALVAAQATLIWAPRVGIYINTGALVIVTAVAIARKDLRKEAISMGILPVANMVVLSIMPTTQFGNTVVFYGTVLVLALIYSFLFILDEPLERTSLGTRGYATYIPIMIFVGQLLGLFGYLFLRHHYPYISVSLPLLALVAVVLGFSEELLLRGLIQQRGENVFHPVIAAVGTTILYTVLGLYHQTMLAIPVSLLTGAVLAFVYYKKQNLLLTTTINVASKLVYVGLVAAFILR